VADEKASSLGMFSDSNRELILTTSILFSTIYLRQSSLMVENPLNLCATDNPPFTRA